MNFSDSPFLACCEKSLSSGRAGSLPAASKSRGRILTLRQFLLFVVAAFTLEDDASASNAGNLAYIIEDFCSTHAAFQAATCRPGLGTLWSSSPPSLP